MSFNDPGFLFSNRPTDNEREAERRAQEYLRQQVQRYYRLATWMVVLTLNFIALPTGLEKWHWQVVIGAGSIILVLAVLMAMKGAVKNALISLLFAAVILPAWVNLHPDVLRVAREQAKVIWKDWQRVL